MTVLFGSRTCSIPHLSWVSIGNWTGACQQLKVSRRMSVEYLSNHKNQLIDICQEAVEWREKYLTINSKILDLCCIFHQSSMASDWPVSVILRPDLLNLCEPDKVCDRPS